MTLDSELDEIFAGDLAESIADRADAALDLFDVCQHHNRVTLVACDAGELASMSATMMRRADVEQVAVIATQAMEHAQVAADMSERPWRRRLARWRLALAAWALGRSPMPTLVPRRSDKPVAHPAREPAHAHR